jgi:hypothetical protein
VTGDTEPAARSGSADYYVDAAATSLEQHGWDIHALRSGAGGARVTEARYGVRVPPYRGGKLAGMRYR